MVDTNLFLHEADKNAMRALKAIPGFSQVMKAFMKIWNEKQLKIYNMSTNLRVGTGQLERYKKMLVPICDKLSIDIPELYVQLDVTPNAYTYGDTSPFIVITSGLLETIPDYLVPTVLAHECGHIACHHTLYTTMGKLILNGAAPLISSLSEIALYPIQYAFAYWMRCSEYSADRVAAICDGTSDKVVELCMRFAGYDKDIIGDADSDLFLEQANDYRKLVNDNVFNKALEFILFKNCDHPMNAIRAHEIDNWAKTEHFADIMDYLNAPVEEKESERLIWLPVKKYINQEVQKVQQELLNFGFENITLIRETETDYNKKSNRIVDIFVDGDNISTDEWHKASAYIELVYYKPKTEDEIAKEHIGEIYLKDGTKPFIGIDVQKSLESLKSLGFVNIEIKEMAIPKIGLGAKPNHVAQMIINQSSQVEKRSWFAPDAAIILYYYVSI